MQTTDHDDDHDRHHDYHRTMYCRLSSEELQ